MSESRRPSSGGGNRRAAGVRRTPSGKSAKGGAGKGSSRSGSSKSTGSAKGTSRTASKGTSGAGTGAAATTSAASASSAKRPTSRTSVSARHAGAAPKGAGTGRGKKVAATNFLNYPRAGRKNPWRWIPSLRMIVGAMALFVLAGLGFAVWLYNDTEVPEPSDFALAQTSRVYFADGETEMGQFSEVNRTELPADEVPDTVKQAVVASEDSSFYENRGVSPRGIVRAFVNNLQGGARQGGSTITMQYVERYYTGTETSYVGKAKEAIMALKADQELSKDEILSRYLNTIYFGRGAYGVQEASQAYFDKDASELTDAEAALLVAVIPSPSTYDPANDPEKSTQLWDRVITRQVAEEQMTPAEADALEFPQTVEPNSENSLGGTNGYLLSQVRNELIAEGFTEDEINTGGFTIVSTIDPAIQENTVQAVENLPEDRPENNRVGTVTMDPSTGAIRGMYGGADYVTQAQNDATQSRMQAGSIFKTFTLIAALEDGYPLDSRWDGDSPKTFRGGWTVKNFNDVDYGRVTLEKATTNSINTAYAEANLEIGPERTQETAISLGLPEKTPGLNADASNVLGSASPTVAEMAEVYGSIASGGVHRDSYIVQTVTRPDGSSRYEHEADDTRAMDEEVAINATVAAGPADGAPPRLRTAGRDRPVAGKTGTSGLLRLVRDHRSWCRRGHVPARQEPRAALNSFGGVRTSGGSPPVASGATSCRLPRGRRCSTSGQVRLDNETLEQLRRRPVAEPRARPPRPRGGTSDEPSRASEEPRRGALGGAERGGALGGGAQRGRQRGALGRAERRAERGGIPAGGPRGRERRG